MRARNVLIAGLTLAVLSTPLHSGDALAQDGQERYTLVVRGARLQEALEELARITEIDLIYSSDLVADRVVYCDGRNMAAEALLGCLLSASGLDYVRASTGTYVLIESLNEHPLFGDVAGRIVDGGTGEPLPHANVLLADASAGTTTNDAGLFHIASVISGKHRILVTYVGYETTVDSLVVEPGSQSIIEIELRPTTLAMEPIVIDGLTQRLPSRGLGGGETDSRRSTDVGAAGTPDVARSARRIAGVSTRHPLADLHIQGGDAGEHLTLIDGAPVRDPVTLGRHLGAFSPLAIHRITVRKAGFGASRGSHLSGVVEVEHDVSPTQNRTASLHVDPVSISGKAQARIPLPDGRSADGMVSLRSSVWDVYRDPGLESLLDRWNAVDPILAGIWIRQPVSATSLTSRRHLPDLAFTDLHAAGSTDLGPFSRLHASAYRATNRIGTELAAVNAPAAAEEDRLVLTRDDYDWTNWAAQVRHTWLSGARSSVTLQVFGSGHSSSYRYLSLYDDVPAGTEDVEPFVTELRPALESAASSNEVNRIRELTARASLSRSITPNRHVELSLEATRVESWFELGNHFIAPFTHAADAWEVAGYGEGRLSLGMQTTLEPGLRLTYLPSRQTLYAEPRLAVRYDRASSPLGPYALRLAGGLYRQFIPSFALTSSGSTSVVPFIRFWLPSDRSLAPPQAYHAAAEGLFMPDEKWTVSIETYYKWHPRLLTLDYVSLIENYPSVRPRPDPVRLRQSDFISPAGGRSLGGSLRLAFAGARRAASVQYGYSLAERTYPHRFGGARQPVPWNQPHRLSGSTELSLTSSLALHAETEAAWGQSWALRRAYYDYLALLAAPRSFPPFDLDEPGEATLPAYFDVDVGLTYDVQWKPVTLRIHAAVINVLDRHNVYDWSLEPAESRYANLDRSLPGRRPVLSLRLMY